MRHVWTSVAPLPRWTIHLAASDEGLMRLDMSSPQLTFLESLPAADWKREDDHPVLKKAARQLAEYFDGRRREFDVPLDLRGTSFQQRVWQGLQQIPYGQTWSYAKLAKRVGSPLGFRAVGQANGRNPVAIIVPCHRVIAADGSIGGYSGGLDFKRRLLDIERRSKSSS